jgi:hypothetical protein
MRCNYNLQYMINKTFAQVSISSNDQSKISEMLFPMC